jgi:hypothetical protein
MGKMYIKMFINYKFIEGEERVGIDWKSILIF